ncbi:putative quinol monooxygenase [Nocardia sp. NPDC049220]|uniref:putative quinol monooxygenase n=1 Tax=Nocardia sp. NPDC049220 TaxID=3155273 RepID=UPI0033FC902C
MAVDTLVLNVRFIAKPGHETDLRDLLQSMIEPTLAEQGCLDYQLYLHPTDPSRVMLVEEWFDADCLATQFQTPHFKAGAAALEEILVEPIQVRRLREIE